METHFPEERLRQFVGGRLPLSDSTDIESHLEVCDECSRLLESVGSQADPLLAGLDFAEAEAASDGGLALCLGATIDQYRLIEQLGEGGMGIVYLAEQLEPVRRQVVLKIIKPGTDSRQIISRFETERQALALMDHPHIARIYDAGTTGGRPYFVMELVHGSPITRYCETRQLSLDERLRLFIPVCLAVHHAHQRGIIHRDLKPSNVIVCDGEGKPLAKVIDFGVAKAIHDPLTRDTLFTQVGQLVGTLEYMSPEQANLRQPAIDTRSDVYSLGVLLYELITGTTPLGPLKSDQTPYDELLRAIREVEAPAPSRRLAALHRARPCGDLDWIVLKAIDKDRERRYDSAQALAEDLQRHLDHQPVAAHPPSRVYQVRKFVRRHRAGVAFGLSFAVLMVAATIVSLWSAGRARRSEVVAKSEQQRAELLSRKHQELSARLLADQGLEQLRDGELEAGLLLLAESLRVAPAEAAPLREVLAANIAAWQPTAHRLKLILPHPDIVRAVAISPDGQHVVSGCEDHGARLWNVETGALIGEPLMHEGRVLSVAFSPDGQTFATGTGETRNGVKRRGTVHLWDAGSRQPRGEPLQLEGNVNGVAFSPDGSKLLIAANNLADNQAVGVQLWDVNSRQPMGHVMQNPQTDIRQVLTCGFSPDGQRIISGTGSRSLERSQVTAQIWEVATQREVGEAMWHTAAIHAVGFSPDGQLVATGSFDHTVRLWNTATQQPVGQPLAHPAKVRSLGFTPDGTTLITGCEDGAIRFWQVRTGQLLGGALAHDAYINTLAVSVDGQTLVSGSWDKTVRVWELAAAPARSSASASSAARELALATVPARRPFVSASRSPDGQTLAAGDAAGGLSLFEVASGAPRAGLQLDDEPVEQIAYVPDGRLALVTPKRLLLWDAARNERLLIDRPAALRGMRLIVSFSGDGTTIAISSRNSAEAFIFDAVSGGPRGSPLVQQDVVASLALSTSGQRLAVGTAWDRTRAPVLQLWNVDTGQPIGRASPHAHFVTTTVFGPRDDVLLSGSEDGYVRLFDALSGAPVAEPIEHELGFVQAAFLQTGDTVLTLAGSGRCRLWRRTDTGLAVDTNLPPLFDAAAKSLAVAPNGQHVAIVYDDGRVQLWDLAARLPVGPAAEHASPVLHAGFSPDGRTLVTFTVRGVLRRWEVPFIAAESIESPEQLRTRLEAYTGITLDEAFSKRLLPAEQWQLRVRQYADTQRAASVEATMSIDHDQRALQHARALAWAEETDDTFAAAWHAQRLLELALRRGESISDDI